MKIPKSIWQSHRPGQIQDEDMAKIEPLLSTAKGKEMFATLQVKTRH
jgi:hypothetical protein